MRTILLYVSFLVYGPLILAQTADVNRGCVPLTVNFTSPTQSTYYWDFDNSGASSDIANPQHIFAQAGTYTVKLYTSSTGPLVGELTITVYPDILIQIDKDVDLGCIPLDVQFSSDITSHPEIEILDLIWTFGDGATGMGTAPTHTYTFGDVFDISVQVITDLNECNKTVNFDNVLEAEDLYSDIIFPDELSCEVPITIEFTPSIVQNPDHEYFWDFGNGTTSTDYLPVPVTYSESDTFEISLRVTSSTGCDSLNITQLIIGPPSINISFPDTVCIDKEFTIINITQAAQYEWSYGDTLVRSFKKEPKLVYYTSGLKPISLIASNSENCITDTTIYIYIENPDASFYMDPDEFCTENRPFLLIANDTTHAKYEWLGEETPSPTYTLSLIEEERDSLYINVKEEVSHTLLVTSHNGCTSEFTSAFEYLLTEAYFIPDSDIGINSLSVNFSDLSTSNHDIVRRHWYFDDGTDMEVPSDETQISHTYTECGIYYPYLVIEDGIGCIDISKRVKIQVFCTNSTDVDPDSTIISTSSNSSICVGETVTFDITGPANFDYHIATDDDRMSHCWLDLAPTHTYTRPGIYPVDYYVEYEGIILSENRIASIQVLGAYAEIAYMINCDKNYEVEFTSNSQGDEELRWIYNEEIISTLDTFQYTFSELGEHVIYLEAENVSSGCPPDTDSVIIYLTEPIAAFVVPEEMCDSETYILDATASKDVFNPCYKGYLWEFEFQRPIEVGKEKLEHQFVRGPQAVTLTVEDINGCTNSATVLTNVYGIEPDFTIDSTTCLPYPIDIQNLSESDTTIVSWNWNFGSTDENPSHVFDTTDIHQEHTDSILVELQIEDILGCTNKIEKWVNVVEPNFLIGADIGFRACAGQQINLTAIDTSGIISSYDFFWDFGGIAQDTGAVTSYAFVEEGLYTITMNFRHKNGTCDEIVEKAVRVVPSPDAAFTSDIDNEDIVCYPAQITFFADPGLDSDNFSFDWDFGNGDASSELPQPSIEFGQGTHEVRLVITNQAGCTDTLVRDFTLVGPEGIINVDKQMICLGDTIIFTISDTTNVTDYIWDFGDGTTLANQSPVSHNYDLKPSGDSTLVQLILKSTEFACETNINLPIYINEVSAQIDASEALAFCNGELVAGNLSTGADRYLWDFGDGTISTAVIPEKIYDDQKGSYTIILTAINERSGCEDMDTIMISPSVSGLPEDEKIMPNTFSPNNDSSNDFFKPALSSSLEEGAEIKTFKVYNRWGQLVFDNEDTNGWSGRFDGKESPPEVYAYYIEIEIDDCAIITEKGSVTLVR